MSSYLVDIYTPDNIVVKDFDAESLLIPTAAGLINVLPAHASLITELSAGNLLIQQGKKKVNYLIASGLCKVLADRILILTKKAEKVSEE